MKRRYNAINDYLKRRFGERAHKVTLRSGNSWKRKSTMYAGAAYRRSHTSSWASE